MEQPGVWGLPLILDEKAGGSIHVFHDRFPQVDSGMLAIALKKFREPNLHKKSMALLRGRQATGANSSKAVVPSMSKKHVEQILKRLQ